MWRDESKSLLVSKYAVPLADIPIKCAVSCSCNPILWVGKDGSCRRAPEAKYDAGF